MSDMAVSCLIFLKKRFARERCLGDFFCPGHLWFCPFSYYYLDQIMLDRR